VISRFRILAVGLAVLIAATGVVLAQQSFTVTAAKVNPKLVKLFGAGGFKGLPSYGTGILISPKGYILTVNNHILTTSDLRVHVYDGRAFHAKVIAKEPDLDLAILKMEEDVDFLPHYDLAAVSKQPLAEAGDWVLAMSNCFQVATRDEPMSIQRGVIASVAELRGRRGVFDAAFTGDVYFIDAITNNPGAAGGAIVDRKGQLLGVIGRELKNNLTDTWINYAIPIQAKIQYPDEKTKKTVIVDVAEFAAKGMKGEYVRDHDKTKKDEYAGFTGILLVPNPVMATPPYIDEVLPGSPAAQAGLRPDDLIVYVDGELVPTVKQFRDVVKFIAPGNDLNVDVQRGTKMHSYKVKVADPPKTKAGG
jgi:serine protease Do